MRIPVFVLGGAVAIALGLGVVAVTGAATPEPSIAPQDRGAPPAEVYAALGAGADGADQCFVMGQSLIEAPDLAAIDSEITSSGIEPGKPLPASGAITGTFDDVARASGSTVVVAREDVYWTVSRTANAVATRFVKFVTPSGKDVWIAVGTLQRKAACD